MNPVQAHYDQLLGPVYTWMYGGFDVAVVRNRQFFESLGVASWLKGLAVDLGCGSGFQSIPLAEAGFRVLALDLCETLLAELRTNAGTLPVRSVRDDLLNFPNHLDVAPALIVCMGDTLPHLASLDAIAQLIANAYRALSAGGRLVLTFRDLATHELKGTQRFIPVRSEPDRIFTCALDYHADHVEVNDLLYLRTGEVWKFTTSSYRKLRINASQAGELLLAAGFRIGHSSTEQGLVRIVAIKA